MLHDIAQINMAGRRQTQVAETLAHLAADYFAREAGSESLITVTRAELAPHLKQVTIFFSVLPEKFEQKALAFAKRSRSDFREYVKEKTFLNPIPTIDFEIDLGEKNRQRIDELTRS